MLCKFAVTNYRGFEQRIEWDLTKARDYAFNTFAIKNKATSKNFPKNLNYAKIKVWNREGYSRKNFGFAG